MYNEVILKNPERFADFPAPSKEKLKVAAFKAADRLLNNIDNFYDAFPGTSSVNYKYIPEKHFNWESGMLTGAYLLAYKLTHNKKFLEASEHHVDVFAESAKKNIGLDDHDTGFIFIPSCVALYKLTGSEKARSAALKAADILLDHYCFENNFIIRMGKRDVNLYEGYRTLVDSMMNIPLFFWASEETGDSKYRNAAIGHFRTTEKYLMREDGSSFHHYQFDPAVGTAVKGVTLQGNSDDSCWSRGHSWLVYGFPIAYSYTKETDCIDAFKASGNYFLNNLPSDGIPYWDFDFGEGSNEPRDSSAAAVALCGYDEICKHLKNDEEISIYRGAANYLMTILVEKCENNTDYADGLINHITHAKPQGCGIDECAVYGDYFYFEALMRYIDNNFIRFW